MHVFRRWICLPLCLVTLALALPAQAADSPPIDLILDGQKLTMDVPPVIVGGRTLVPLRAIMEALGARVEWNQETKTATVLHEGHEVALPDGSRTAMVDGTEVTLDVPAQTVSGRMLVPVRFLVEATGGEVDWRASENTVIMAVRDEALKGQLRVEKANRDLSVTPPQLTSAAGSAGFTLKTPSRRDFAVDGVVHLEGLAASRLNGSSLLLQILGGGRIRETTLPIKNGAYAGDIYLADGPDWYTIQIFAPENADGEKYTMVSSLSPKNVGTRPRQSPYYARDYAKSGLTLDLPTSGQIAVDTTFPVRGTADPKLNGRFVWLKAEKGNEEWSSYLQIRDGKLVGDAHLGGGPGLHWVTVSLQEKPGSEFYSPVAYVPVMNTSAKPTRQPPVVNPTGQEALLKLAPLPDSVPDGYLTVSGGVDPARKMASVLVKVTHEGKDDQVFLPVTDGRFEGRVPLSLGAGEYELSFMLERYADIHLYQEGATARVTNQAVQVVRGFRYTAQAIEQKLQLTAPATDPISTGAKLTIAGTVGAPERDYPYVLAVTRFKDLEATYRLPIVNGQFSGEAELRFGPGTYEVVLYTQTASTRIAELVRFTVTTSTARDERDLLPSAGIESGSAQIFALAKELTAGKSALEAGRAVFEWTAKNVQYEQRKAFTMRVDPDEGAERTLRTRTGVCRDYAALAVALLRAAGVKSHVVTGRAGSDYKVIGHAWVEFYNGERWVEMDPTFASGVVSGTDFIPQYDARYFDPAPDFLNLTHVRDGIQY